jgi:hypothetical protein
MSRGIVLSLCDLTGNFAKPWLDAGYSAILVDPQHGLDSYERTGRGGAVTRLPLTVEQAMEYTIGDQLDEVVFVAGFPPCTDMAVSGARWFETKRQADPYYQAKAVAVAEQCRTIGRLSGAPWFVENPVSILSSVFGKPNHIFDPHEYTAFEPADNYTKKTCLWTGGGFVMPDPHIDTTLGEPDNRIHFASPGPERANFRSATPMGFARAVFAANSVTMATEAVA